MIAPLWLRRGRTVYFDNGHHSDRAVVCGPVGDDGRVWVRWSSGAATRCEYRYLQKTMPQRIFDRPIARPSSTVQSELRSQEM